MEHRTQVELIQRVHDLLDNKTTHMVDETFERAVEAYIDPARLKRETETVFRYYPIMAAHSSQLADPGDFVTLNALNVPIIVIRSKSGALNAFINVCRHRGTKLVWEECGVQKKALVCPYHGWTYDQDGQLIHITDADGFPDVNKADFGLVRLPVEEKSGFVWVIPSPDRSIDMASFLGTLGHDFDSYKLASHLIYKPYTLRKALNWKLVIDIFLETYHIKYAHTKTIYHLFFNNVGIFDQFYPHMRNLFPKRSIQTLPGTDTANWVLREHANILYYLFPNMLILVQPDHVSYFRVFPNSPEHSTIEAWTLVPEEPITDKARTYWDKNIAMLVSATEEDYVIGELIQQGMKSGANAALKFGRYEQSLMYFHQTVDDALQNDITPTHSRTGAAD